MLELELATINEQQVESVIEVDADFSKIQEDAKIALDIKWTLDRVFEKIKKIRETENVQDEQLLHVMKLESRIHSLKHTNETYL